MAINTHQADHVEYIQDSNGNKHYLNAEYLDGHSYADISNAIGGKADQSAIHDGTLTIQKNGATIATFTANQDKSATANIIVPTSIDGLSGGTVNGNITLTKELVFANNQNPFIKMSTAGNTYFFQSAGGQFSLGPTWDLATKWSVDGSVQFPKKVDFAVRPVVGSKEVALKSEIPAAVSESTVSGWGFTKNKGTVTSVATADGITGGSITSSGTIKANLKSYTKNTAEIGGRLYGVELDKNGKLAVNVPWTDTNTDTKVTSAANHYTPAADSSAQLSVDASSTTAAAWNSTSLVTGVNLQRDAKGHVTGVSVDSIKMPANPNTDTHHVARLYAGLKDTKANGAAGNGSTYLKLVENDTIRDQHNIVGSGTTVVTSDANGKITIDTDTSSLIPYDGATRDVNLGNHSLVISDKISPVGPGIKISGKDKSEDDTYVIIDSNNIKVADARGFRAKLVPGALNITNDVSAIHINVNGFKAQRNLDTNGDGQIEATDYSTYGCNGIIYNGNKLSFPEKEGTIALTSDLSTLLDKGTSSTVVNQVVYNPVEMKKALTVPSIQGTKYTDNSGNQQPLFTLGGTASGSGNSSQASSSLTLYRNRAGSWDSATISFAPVDGLKIGNYAVGVQNWDNVPASYILTNGDGVTKDRNGGVKLKSSGGAASDDFVFESTNNGKLHSKMSIGPSGLVRGGWCIDNSKIMTEANFSFDSSTGILTIN